MNFKLSILVLSVILWGCSSGGKVASPWQPAPQQPTPEQPTPEQPAPEQPAPEQPSPEQPSPEQPSPEQPSPEQPSPEQPSPEQPSPEQPDVYTGRIITRDSYVNGNKLINDGFNGDSGIYTISVDTGTPVITPNTSENEHITGHQLQSLSSDDKLLGYYGYVLSYADREILGQNEKYHRSDYILAMNESEINKPTASAQYHGNVFYDRDGAVGQKANIDLFYDSNKSMLTGTITGDSQRDFNFLINNDQKSNNVFEDGTFIAPLTEPSQGSMQGVLNGAFYGKNGEVAAGTIMSSDNESWGGVFGAKVQ
ncbi:hypothetical protein ACXQFU_003309 [Vibrio cholerae]